MIIAKDILNFSLNIKLTHLVRSIYNVVAREWIPESIIQRYVYAQVPIPIYFKSKKLRFHFSMSCVNEMLWTIMLNGKAI